MDKVKKVKQVNGFIIASCQDYAYKFVVFTTDEWSMGKGYRYPEWECDSLEEAESWCKND